MAQHDNMSFQRPKSIHVGNRKFSESEDIPDPMSFHFPEELLLEILVKLPAKSIFRFRSVSRNWQSLISDPSFLHAYLSRPNDDSPPFALIFQCGKYRGMHCFESSNKRITSLSSQFLFDQIPGLKIEATCNDLILYRSNCQDRSVVYSVANPFTGQSNVLPSHSRKQCCTGEGLLSYVKNGITSYNVVRILKDSGNCNILEIEIFSSQTREWRNVQVRYPACNVEIDARPCIVFSNTLHWICNKMTALLAYDPSTNDCRLIRVPNGAYYMNGKSAILGVSGGNLYYFEMQGICMHDRKLPGWKLWRMKNYENGEWNLGLQGDEKEMESMSVVWIVLSRHSPLFPVALHPWNQGIVYFWCEDYILTFDANRGWFQDELFGLSSGRMDSTVEIFSLLMPFSPSHLSFGL